MVQHHLQILQEMLAASIQFERIPAEAPLGERLNERISRNTRNAVQQMQVAVQGKLSEGVGFIIAVHQLINMSAKALGSKIFEDRSSLKQLMSTNNPQFNQRMKRIVDKNFEAIRQTGIFERRSHPTPNLFYFNAHLYNSSLREELEDFMLQEIEHFSANFEGSYALVYVHASIFDFLAFRRMVEKWPEHFFYNLRRVYILAPSVMVKIIETFSLGSFYRLCDQLFLNLDSEAELKASDEDLLKSLGESSAPPQTPSYKKGVKIIESSLYGKLLDEYDLSSGRYPVILLQLLCRLVRDPSQLKLQGIFRKSCDSEELERMEAEIGRKEKGAIWKQPDILVVCGCLKKVMNNLRHPLFNYGIYQQVIDFQSGDEMDFIRGILAQMEYVNHKVFVLLVIFLNDYIIAQKQFNKMNGYNLAVVLGPCFFRPKEYDLKDLIYSGKFARVLVTCFDRYNQLIDASEIALARGTLQALRADPFKW